jgi:proline racemase
VQAVDDGVVEVTIDVPSGRVQASVHCRAGAVQSVVFRNVPSFVIARGVTAGDVGVDVACGGAIYAFVPAASLGLRVVPEDLPELIAAGRTIKRALEGTDVARHPDDQRLSGIYGTVIHEQLGPFHQRNVAIFADGEVDRSPTGSATSARTALLLADGAIAEGQTWRNDSIVETTFYARATGDVPEGLLTEVEGTAFRTGEHRFLLDDRDPLGTGFVLR